MAARPPRQSDSALSLALAVVAASNAPLLLLDGDLTVIAASASFSQTFKLDAQSLTGKPIYDIGAGEWDVPQLRGLLSATASGTAAVEAYEMDLKRPHEGVRRLVVNAHKLDYADVEHVRVILTVSDVTEARITAKLKDDLLREKAILLQEVQHRVANSLQIIASVLLQNARQVQSAESRGHLEDAHGRVMSIAAVQKQLAASRLGDVALRQYFTQLCQSLGASMIRDHNQLSVEVTVDDSSATADVSVSLGLIVTELVINALKHAFPGGRSGKIKVDYRSQGPDWTLAVRDNGVGMPTDAQAAKPGLGTSIIEALANQLDADIETENARPGTSIRVSHRQSAANDESDVDAAEAKAV